MTGWGLHANEPTGNLRSCPSASQPRSRMAELERQPWRKAARFNKSSSKPTFLLRALLGSQQRTSWSCKRKGNGNIALAGVVFCANFGVPEEQRSKKHQSGWVIKVLRSRSPTADGLACSGLHRHSKMVQPAAWMGAVKRQLLGRERTASVHLVVFELQDLLR